MNSFQLLGIFIKNIGKYIFAKEPFLINISGFKYKIEPRSDEFLILWEVFVGNVYEASFDLGKVNTIIDVGGYTGDFSLWAFKKFKPKVIYSLEPDDGLYELLVENVALNGLTNTIKCVNKALLEGKSASIKKGFIKSTTKVISDESGDVDTISLKDFINVYGLKTIDYFKMDIEGGEVFVLTEENKDIFKNYVKYVSMETHRNGDFTKEDCRKYFNSINFDIHERKLLNGNTELEALNTQLTN